MQATQSLDELAEAVHFNVSRAELGELVNAGILVEPLDPEINRLLLLREEWARFNWESAFYFHWFTRDYEFIDYSEAGSMASDRALMDQYSAVGLRPTNYKEGYSETLLLPRPAQTHPQRSYSESFEFHLFNHDKQIPVSVGDLSALLFATAGQIGTKMWPGQGSFIRRTAPSGGARHPTEVYLSLLDVNGVPPGLYHYDVEHHGLHRLESGQCELALIRAIPDLKDRLRFRPHAVLVLTSMVERSMWRYRDSRSFRVILLDVGHLATNFRVAAEQLQLPYFVGQGFTDSTVADLLGLEIDREIPVLFAAI